jgi:hypothetical protein
MTDPVASLMNDGHGSKIQIENIFYIFYLRKYQDVLTTIKAEKKCMS